MISLTLRTPFAEKLFMEMAARNFKIFSFTQCLLVFGILFGSLAEAATGLTYHGRILKPDGLPLTAASVFFDIQIRSPGAENCLLYGESQTLSMTGSAGVFVVTIGEGTRVAAGVDGGYSFDRIFANRGTLTLPTCNVGTTYTPNIADGRKLVVQFNDGSGWQALPAQNINYVPLAIEAVQISGYKKDQLLRVADGVVATEFSSANWTALSDLIAGTSTLYTVNNSTILASAGTNSAPSHSFSGDANTGFYNSVADTLSITAGGAKIFDMSASGLISPTVGGAAVSTAAGTATAPTFSFAGDTDTGLFRSAADTLAVSTAGTERMRIDSLGNVSIGTPSTLYKLEVLTAGNAGNTRLRSGGVGNSVAAVLAIDRENTASNGGAGLGGEIVFNLENSVNSFSINANIGAVSTNATSTAETGDLYFSTRNSGTLSEKVRILGNGNFGIGTTTPAEKLEVNGAVKIGSSAAMAAGTLRWTGTNFQGTDGVSWFNIMPNPPAAGGCDQTQTFNTVGTYGYTVPASYATITIKLWGGGGGGSHQSAVGTPGGTTTISSLGLGAGGGGPGVGGSAGYGAGGAGGVASGGTVNTPGNPGATAVSGSGGAGGSAPAGGGAGGVGTTGCFGVPGAAPGGGGGGTGITDPNRGGGGGSGGYTEKTFTPATLPVGTTINDILVAAGGAGGHNGCPAGAGGTGRVTITCSTTGSPPVNNRGILFLDSGAYTSDTNFVYDSGGKLGLGTSSPQATLDINGHMRMSKNTVAPAACSAANDGSIALTSLYTTCVCKGGTSSWVSTVDGTTACTWQ